MISATEQRRVLDVIPGRSKQAVQQWLHALPADVAGHIQVVSIDPCDAYRRAIQAELPHAVNVCDPSHLVRGAGTAMDSARRDRQGLPAPQVDWHTVSGSPAVRQATQLAA